MTLQHAFTLLGLLLLIGGAALAIVAERVEIRNDIDNFMADMKRASKWNIRATAVTAIGATWVAISVWHASINP